MDILLIFAYAQDLELTNDFNFVNIAAFITAIGAAFSQVYRIWKEKREAEGAQNARVREVQIETKGTIEQINTTRTDQLFSRYETQIHRQQQQNTILQNNVQQLQKIVQQLQAEVTKLRVENAYLRGVVEDDPKWADKIDLAAIEDFISNLPSVEILSNTSVDPDI
jgi:predicted RNase H-like nuclease (RuvC/YqgF family)